VLPGSAPELRGSHGDRATSREIFRLRRECVIPHRMTPAGAAPNTRVRIRRRFARLKPNFITLAGSKLFGDQFRTCFEPDSVMEFGREPASSC